MSGNTSIYNINSVVFREGDDASKLYIIKSGEVICLKSSQGRLIPVFLAKANDIIGESAILEGAP
jgi:CRP-like cAMP-binding protein